MRINALFESKVHLIIFVTIDSLSRYIHPDRQVANCYSALNNTYKNETLIKIYVHKKE